MSGLLQRNAVVVVVVVAFVCLFFVLLFFKTKATSDERDVE